MSLQGMPVAGLCYFVGSSLSHPLSPWFYLLSLDKRERLEEREGRREERREGEGEGGRGRGRGRARRERGREADNLTHRWEGLVNEELFTMFRIYASWWPLSG